MMIYIYWPKVIVNLNWASKIIENILLITLLKPISEKKKKKDIALF